MSLVKTNKLWKLSIDVSQEALSIEFPNREPMILRGEITIVEFISECCEAIRTISLSKRRA